MQPRQPRMTLNPWLSMWTRPRETIRRIVDENPGHSVNTLAALAGIGVAFEFAVRLRLGDSWSSSSILLFAIFAGPIVGLIRLYLGTLLIAWTGSWIGGRGNRVHIRASLAWSQIPAIWGLGIWAFGLLTIGSELFTTEKPGIEQNPGPIQFMASSMFVVGVWSIVVACKAIGEVQGFSAWKGLANLLLAILVIIVPLAMLARLVGLEAT